MKKQLFVTAGSLLALVLMAVPSQATIFSSRTRTTADVFTDSVTHLIPLNNAGATSLTFTTTAASTTVVISYNAECSVKGTDNITWLDIDILVDGVAAAPSSSDNAFCTDHGNNMLGNWVSAVTTVVVSGLLPAHTQYKSKGLSGSSTQAISGESMTPQRS